MLLAFVYRGRIAFNMHYALVVHSFGLNTIAATSKHDNLSINREMVYLDTAMPRL